jgi:hypothetical protein
VNGPRNQFRSTSFGTILDTLKEYVQNWKTQKLPLVLHGESGTGKTRCLKLLGDYLELDCEFLHDMFIDQLSKEELKERFAGLGSKGLSCKPKLWIIEHYDCLTETQKSLLYQHAPSIMKTGALVCTSWPTLAQPSTRFLYIEFIPWSLESKQVFLNLWRPDIFKDKKIQVLALKEGGENISSALCLAQLWTGSPPIQSKTVAEEDSYVPINPRLLIEESFSDRWCTKRSLALEAGDSEITVQLLQETLPIAIMQGRCKDDINLLSSSLEFLSVMNATVKYNASAFKPVLDQRLLQLPVKKAARFSLEKFNSGSLMPIPQSLVQRSKGITLLKQNRELIYQSRGSAGHQSADTRVFSEDIQLFLQAAKKPWKSPFSIK